MPRARAQALPNTVALIVNHENITQNWYVGNDRSMLVCNCLFRIGGAAAVMSNRCVVEGGGSARTAPAGDPACVARLWAELLHAPARWCGAVASILSARGAVCLVSICSVCTKCAVCHKEAALLHYVSRRAAGPPCGHGAALMVVERLVHVCISAYMRRSREGTQGLPAQCTGLALCAGYVSERSGRSPHVLSVCSWCAGRRVWEPGDNLGRPEAAATRAGRATARAQSTSSRTACARTWAPRTTRLAAWATARTRRAGAACSCAAT